MSQQDIDKKGDILIHRRNSFISCLGMFFLLNISDIQELVAAVDETNIDTELILLKQFTHRV